MEDNNIRFIENTSSISTGDIVLFGRYRQNSFEDTNDIQWIVLKTEEENNLFG